MPQVRMLQAGKEVGTGVRGVHALSQYGCCGDFCVSGTDPGKHGRGTLLVLAARVRRGVWAEHGEGGSSCSVSPFASKLPAPASRAGWPPSRRGRCDEALRQQELGGWMREHHPCVLEVCWKMHTSSETSTASGNTLVTLVLCTEFHPQPGLLSPSLPLCVQDGVLEARAVTAGCSSPAACGHHTEDQCLQHQGVWRCQDVQPDDRKYHRLCECWGLRSSPSQSGLWDGARLGSLDTNFLQTSVHPCIHPPINLLVHTTPSTHLCLLVLHPPIHPSGSSPTSNLDLLHSC